MPMEPGTALGPYRITRKLGAGGMGEVYAATDTRLGREVAIKVLPKEMTLDPDALRRFQQEAMTVAALNHPNIVNIFDVGAAEDGSPYLVMELLDGESLRAKMASKPMSVRKVAEICAQLAHALGAAHSKGIIHRDLKPENVYLIKQGPAKILDFGLAKLAQRDEALADVQDDATKALFTKPGMVLGTVGYMSPEQVEGKNADARSDIFSLGVMMWEMVSGIRPFHRNSSIDTLHAILREDPPEVDASLGLPAAMERILRRCLEKDPDDRFQSAQDLAFQLENLSTASGAATTVRLSAITGESVEKQPWYKTPHRLFYPLPVKLPSKLKVCFWDRVQLSVAYLAAAALLVAALLVSLGVLDIGFGSKRELAKKFEPAMDVSGNIQSAAISRNGEHTVLAITDASGETKLLYRRKGESAVALEKPPALEVLAVANSSTALLKAASGDLYLQEMGQDSSAMKIATRVQEADLTPDGSKIAILRRNGDKFDIEYPQSTVCYSSKNRMRDLKVSPKGDALAFMERDTVSGSFSLKVWRSSGAMETWKGGPKLSRKGYFSPMNMRGLAWNREGNGLYIAMSGNLLGLIRKNGETILHRDAGSLKLRGATDEGPLLEVGAELVVDRGRFAQSEKELDLSWTGGSIVALSEDSTRLLVARENEVWLLPSNRSKGRKISAGTAEALSGDGKTVLLTNNERILAVPAEGGDTRLVTTRDELRKLGCVFTGENTDPKLALSGDGKWAFISTKQLLIRKRTDGSGSMETLDVPVEGLDSEWRIDSATSQDGNIIAIQIRDASEQRWCLAFEAAAKKQLGWTKLEDGERLMARQPGGECLVFSSGKGSGEFRSLDLKTGQRKGLRSFTPPIPDASARFRSVRCSANGNFYTYHFTTMSVSQLVLGKGL